MNRDTLEMIARVERLGISADDAWGLRRVAMTLHRWHEMECGVEHGCVERDETTKLTYWHSSVSGRMTRIPDRESGAHKRLAAILARYPTLRAYIQGDPRGASLYLYPADAIEAYNARCPREDGWPVRIDSIYSSVGTAVYK